MEKWDTLKAWVQIHASLDNKLPAKGILEYIETLEDEEKSFALQLARERMARKEQQANTA